MNVSSRLLLGTARYPSPQVMADAVKARARRHRHRLGAPRAGRAANTGERFFELISALGVRVMPNTAGCRTPQEAIATAQMARELFGTDWVKLEVIGNDDTLQPDLFGLVEAAGRARSSDGFKVFPYTTEDLVAAERLRGCGLRGADALGRADRHRPRARQPLCAAARCALLSRHAADHRCRHRRALACGAAMEMGFDAVLLNTAVARAADPVRMARAFAGAIEAGRSAYEAGLMEMRDMAAPSTPVAGTPFFDLDKSVMARWRRGLDVFYPIVPDVAWLGRLGAARGEDRSTATQGCAAPERIRREIAESLEICAPPRLPADRQRLLARGFGARRRLSSIWARRTWPTPTSPPSRPRARASASARTAKKSWPSRWRREPTYVALGPIYETRLKVMKWAPQGLHRVTMESGASAACLWWPLAASRLSGRTVWAAGADSLAVITDFFTHANPRSACANGSLLARAHFSSPRKVEDGLCLLT